MLIFPAGNLLSPGIPAGDKNPGIPVRALVYTCKSRMSQQYSLQPFDRIIIDSIFSNCLFRALSDQMDGHMSNHMLHRMNTVRFMIENRDDFEPFMDMPFERYGEQHM